MSEKISVGILGATGTVGQRMLTLLHDHPLFEVTALAASERSVGKTYAEAVRWHLPSALPETFGRMQVSACEPELPCRIILSALDASVAGETETRFAEAGYAVVSNARNHRMEEDVPLLIPEVNPEQLALIDAQRRRGRSGFIVTNPNCSTIGLVLALKPLEDRFGLKAVHVTTLQALSGAGYPGISSADILDNVIPFIRGEEEKIETETFKILGREFPLSAQCNRVPVRDGHLECVSVDLAREASEDEIISAWEAFLPEKRPTRYLRAPDRPQPMLDRDAGGGMTVSIGRLRPCRAAMWKFAVLSHNTVRGAAGAAIANAELLAERGYLTGSRRPSATPTIKAREAPRR